MGDQRHELPPLFVERLNEIVAPEQRGPVVSSFGVERPAAFRINPLRGNAGAALDELKQVGLTPEPVGWCEHAYTVPREQREALTHASAVGDGRVYVQGLSSLLAALALRPRAGERVLDLAAAPGGKTLHMAALMNNEGRIAAVESARPRYYKLKANVEAACATCVDCYCADGRYVGRKQREAFDAVLVDAPCSGEARFGPREPGAWRYWSEKKIKRNASMQKALLRSAIDATRVGGRIVYATCTLGPEENEGVIDHTLRRVGESVAVEPIELPIDNVQPGLSGWRGKAYDALVAHTRRVLPDGRMTAFYLAKLVKRASTS